MKIITKRDLAVIDVVRAAYAHQHSCIGPVLRTDELNGFTITRYAVSNNGTLASAFVKMSVGIVKIKRNLVVLLELVDCQWIPRTVESGSFRTEVLIGGLFKITFGKTYQFIEPETSRKGV